jgi:hypothetical protein
LPKTSAELATSAHRLYSQLIAAWGLAAGLTAPAAVEAVTPVSIAPATHKIPEMETVRKSFMHTLR